MQYLLMIHGDEKAMGQASKEQVGAMMAAYGAYTNAMKEAKPISRANGCTRFDRDGCAGEGRQVLGAEWRVRRGQGAACGDYRSRSPDSTARSPGRPLPGAAVGPSRCGRSGRCDRIGAKGGNDRRRESPPKSAITHSKGRIRGVDRAAALAGKGNLKAALVLRSRAERGVSKDAPASAKRGCELGHPSRRDAGHRSSG